MGAQIKVLALRDCRVDEKDHAAGTVFVLPDGFGPIPAHLKVIKGDYSPEPEPAAPSMTDEEVLASMSGVMAEPAKMRPGRKSGKA